MAAAIGHETNKEFNRNIFNLLQVAVKAGLSNQNVVDSNTIATLKTKVADLQATNDENTKNLLRHCQSAIQAAKDVGIFVDADISSLTTTAGLLAVFSGLDSDLSTTKLTSLAYSPRTGSV